MRGEGGRVLWLPDVVSGVAVLASWVGGEQFDAGAAGACTSRPTNAGPAGWAVRVERVVPVPISGNFSSLFGSESAGVRSEGSEGFREGFTASVL